MSKTAKTPKAPVFANVDTMTAEVAVLYVLAIVGAERGFFSALIGRGREFLEAFCSSLNAIYADNDANVIRAAYLRVRAAAEYADAGFTVSSRTAGGVTAWRVVDFTAASKSDKSADSAGSAGKTDKASPIAVELAKAHARIKELETIIATRDATIEALNAKLQAATRPASAPRVRKSSAPLQAVANG